MTTDTIAIACDHGALALKTHMVTYLKDKGYEILDLGVNGPESVDYPDFGYKVAQAIKEGTVTRGILMCGSGIGISIAANRFTEIRCALVHDVTGARLTREHNDANVIAFGGRMIGPDLCEECVDTFLTTKFEGGRHQRRVDKLSNPSV
ncbi:MAG: ribose 5-phosphate isomerase B [Rhodospirillaceae bacterium]|nr:MAG: ribose 5-phosphate isomerase B [Rhodospirillaceae bacterium]